MGLRLGKRLGLLGGWALPALLGAVAAGGAGRAAEAGRRPIRYTITGREPFERLGTSFDVLGDMDGDGVAELVYGVPGYAYPEGSEERRGKVVIASGRTGEEIRSWMGLDLAWWYYGISVANGGDIDGDGTDDVLVRCGAVVEQRFSSTGERGVSFYNNEWLTCGYLLSLGDVDGDGVPDFVVGVPYPQDWPARGRLFAHSGRGGTLWEYVSEEERTVLGGNMARIDDLDGDGVPELGVAEPGGEQQHRLSGKLHIFRARDGVLLRTLTDGVVDNYFGASFAQISDLDGDGVRELAVGVTNASVRGLKGAGGVQALSIPTGEVFWSLQGVNGDRSPLGEGYLGDAFGGAVRALGDLTADGHTEVAFARRSNVLYSEGDYYLVMIACGRTGAPLAVVEAEQDHIQFASSIRRLGDIDGDGRPEFAASAPRYDSAASGNSSRSYGRIYVLGYDPEGVPFIRGDADADGRVNVNDAAVTIAHLLYGTPVPCEEALDIDRYRGVRTTDAVLLLSYLFLGGMAPELPFPDCARLLTPREVLPCERSSCGP